MYELIVTAVVVGTPTPNVEPHTEVYRFEYETADQLYQALRDLTRNTRPLAGGQMHNR